MPNLTIRSKKLNREFSFFMPPNGGYVRLEDDRNHGTLGRQICVGGGFMGNTIVAYTEESFKRQCREWYRAHIRKTGYGGMYEFEYA